MTPITVGAYRSGDEPMLVVSGAMGKEKIHYEAPPSDRIADEVRLVVQRLKEESTIEPLLKAGIAHLWFINIHPFDDGNGRLTRTITDMILARADGQPKRFYSMSAAILRNKKSYYDTLEYMGKHGLDITQWLLWFLLTLEDAIDTAQTRTLQVIRKSLFWQRHHTTVLNERQIKMINRLWDGFEGKLSTGKWAKMTKSSQATALRDIQDLVAKGILHKTDDKGRNAGYELAID
jgi:Fic family protein